MWWVVGLLVFSVLVGGLVRGVGSVSLGWLGALGDFVSGLFWFVGLGLVDIVRFGLSWILYFLVGLV